MIKIKNKTRFNGRDLSTLVRGAQRALKRTVRRDATITVVTYHPRGATLVHANRGATPADRSKPREHTLKLAAPDKIWTSAVDRLAASNSVREVPDAMLVAIVEGIYYLVTGNAVNFGGGLPLWAKRVRVSPPEERPEKLTGLDYHRNKLDHEEAKLNEWSEKLARAQKMTKKWRRAVRSRKSTIRRMKKAQGVPLVGPGGDQ